MRGEEKRRGWLVKPGKMMSEKKYDYKLQIHWELKVIKRKEPFKL